VQPACHSPGACAQPQPRLLGAGARPADLEADCDVGTRAPRPSRLRQPRQRLQRASLPPASGYAPNAAMPRRFDGSRAGRAVAVPTTPRRPWLRMLGPPARSRSATNDVSKLRVYGTREIRSWGDRRTDRVRLLVAAFIHRSIKTDTSGHHGRPHPEPSQEHQIEIWCSQRQGLSCSVNDAVNVLPCATWAYLNGGPFVTCSTFTRRR
jgi:hypothetical protein